MSHDRPTPAERAFDLTHDPKTCRVCLNPNLYGEQAPDPEELAHAREVDALRAQVATLTAERDHWKASHASVNATLDAVLAGVKP